MSTLPDTTLQRADLRLDPEWIIPIQPAGLTLQQHSVLIRDGRIVDFHKRPTEAHDWHGESVGFFRLAPVEMGKILATAERLSADGGAGLEYEEAIRLAMQAEPDRFGFADVSGLPWTEIDFPEDVEKANQLLSELADAPVGPAGESHP